MEEKNELAAVSENKGCTSATVLFSRTFLERCQNFFIALVAGSFSSNSLFSD